MKRAVLAALVLVVAALGAVPAHAATPNGVRIAGVDRIGTSVAVSQEEFPKAGAKAVVLARDDDFADALSGAPLAVAMQAPLLLTDPNSLDPRIDTEIKRVMTNGQTIYILGLQDAVSDSVATQLTGEGYTVQRVGGADRFATAAAVAGLLGTPNDILLATGDSSGDALAAGAAAASIGGVVLLTDDTAMPASTQSYLSKHGSVPTYAIGGPAAGADPGAMQIVGADRYTTSVMVAQKFFTAPILVGVANGFAYPDALSGGPAVGSQHSPLVLIAPDDLPPVVHDYLVSIHSGLTAALVFGGPAVIPDGVLAAIDSAIQGN